MSARAGSSSARAIWLLDAAERRHHLGHALAGEILVVAGFEDLDHAIADILGKSLLDVALERGRQVVCRLIDVFGRREDLLRRLLASPGMTASSSLTIACGRSRRASIRSGRRPPAAPVMAERTRRSSAVSALDFVAAAAPRPRLHWRAGAAASIARSALSSLHDVGMAAARARLRAAAADRAPAIPSSMRKTLRGSAISA